MTSDPVRTETQKTPFFTTLRRLARQVDSGIKDIQLKLETQPGHGEDSHVASKTLRESKKEMEALKKNARSSLADMRKRNGEFEKMLQLCRDVVDHQLNQLTAIQEYLGQYGYIPSQGRANKGEPVAEDENSESAEVKHSDTPEKESKVSEMRMSPRLEDFGISSYTLNMMNNRPPPQQSDFKVPSAVPVNNGCKTRHDSVPTPFQTKGLTVTPSLFSSQYRKEATNDGMSPSLSCSPANTVFKPPNRAEAGESAPVPTSPEQLGLAKALDFTDSPVPPVLHTPGMKQIPRMREFMAQSQKGDDQLSSPVPPVFLTPGLKQIPTKAEMTQEAAPGRRVAKQLKLGDDPQAVDSPVPPVLKTPGIKQITKGSSNLASDLAGKESAAFAGRGWTEKPEVPKTPELTFSLKDLEEMTMSFRNTSLTNTFSEKTMNLTSDLNKSKFTQGAGLSGQAWHRSLPQHHSVPGADSEEDTWGVKKTSQHFGGLGSSRMHDLPSEPPLPNLRTNRFGFTADCSSEMPSMPEMRSVSRMESHAPDAQVHRFGQSQSGRYKQEDLKNFENDQTWKSTAAAKHSRLEMSDSATEEHTSRYGVAEKFAQDRFGVKGTAYTGADMDNDRRGFRPFVKTEEPAAKYGQGFGLHYNKENLELPATPELTSIKLEDSTVSEVGQPRLPRPLADSNLDLPPTPKFMGSYHFMNSKR